METANIRILPLASVNPRFLVSLMSFTPISFPSVPVTRSFVSRTGPFGTRWERRWCERHGKEMGTRRKRPTFPRSHLVPSSYSRVSMWRELEEINRVTWDPRNERRERRRDECGAVGLFPFPSHSHPSLPRVTHSAAPHSLHSSVREMNGVRRTVTSRTRGERYDRRASFILLRGSPFISRLSPHSSSRPHVGLSGSLRSPFVPSSRTRHGVASGEVGRRTRGTYRETETDMKGRRKDESREPRIHIIIDSGWKGRWMEGEGTEPGMNHLQPPHPFVTHSPHVVHHSCLGLTPLGSLVPTGWEVRGRVETWRARGRWTTWDGQQQERKESSCCSRFTCLVGRNSFHPSLVTSPRPFAAQREEVGRSPGPPGRLRHLRPLR